MRISRRQWLIAIGWAALLHLLVIALLVWSPKPPAGSAETSQGVTVSLDDSDASPPPPPSIEDMPIEELNANNAEAGDTPARPRSLPPETNGLAAPDAPIQAANPVGPVIGEAPSEQTAPASASEAAPPEAQSSAPTDANGPLAPASGTAGTPAIASALSVTPEQTLSDTLPATQVTARDALQLPDLPSNPNGSGATGSPDQATDDYITQLRTWLARHKHYPDKARRKHVEGIVKLFIAVDAGGHVLETRIVDSSGSPALDAAARRMLAASQPLPPMPAAAKRNRLELIIPIVFSLH